jgi:hypothetical protein
MRKYSHIDLKYLDKNLLYFLGDQEELSVYQVRYFSIKLGVGHIYASALYNFKSF